MDPVFPSIPGARRIWARPDGIAVIDELDDEVRALVMRAWKTDFSPPTAIEFHLDAPETERFRRDPDSAAELAADVLKRPGFYHGRRARTAGPRSLVRRIWQSVDGKDQVDQDEQGDCWMDAAVLLGLNPWRIQFRLHPGEAASCASDPEQARALADRARAVPELFRLRPPERWEPGKPKRIWTDSIGQWTLEEDDAGGVWLEAVIYDGFTAYAGKARLEPRDAGRCRRSWKAAEALAGRLIRSKGKYP